MDTVTGQQARVNYFPECSDEDKARLDAILRGASVFRKICFSRLPGDKGEPRYRVDIGSRNEEPHPDIQSQSREHPELRCE